MMIKGFKFSKYHHISFVVKANGKFIVYIDGKKCKGDFTIDGWVRGLVLNKKKGAVCAK